MRLVLVQEDPGAPWWRVQVSDRFGAAGVALCSWLLSPVWSTNIQAHDGHRLLYLRGAEVEAGGALSRPPGHPWDDPLRSLARCFGPELMLVDLSAKYLTGTVATAHATAVLTETGRLLWSVGPRVKRAADVDGEAVYEVEQPGPISVGPRAFRVGQYEADLLHYIMRREAATAIRAVLAAVGKPIEASAEDLLGLVFDRLALLAARDFTKSGRPPYLVGGSIIPMRKALSNHACSAVKALAPTLADLAYPALFSFDPAQAASPVTADDTPVTHALDRVLLPRLSEATIYALSTTKIGARTCMYALVSEAWSAVELALVARSQNNAARTEVFL